MIKNEVCTFGHGMTKEFWKYMCLITVATAQLQTFEYGERIRYAMSY